MPVQRPGEAEQLIERWQVAEGEERDEAFYAIFIHFYPLVRRFFSRRAVPPGDVEDLVQETLLRVYLGLEQFRREGPFEGWIFHIAANVYLNAVRRMSAPKRSSEIALDGTSDPIEDPISGKRIPDEPLGQVLDLERQTLVHRAIEGLPTQMRRCVELRVGQDMKYREIAEVLRLSIDTVKAHLFQARKRLQHELRDYFPEI